MKRREFLWCGSAFLASSSWARTAAPAAVLSEYENSSGGHIGVYARNVRTGATWAWRADERFVMCSTFKASLAACVLSNVDRGEDDLERPVRYGAADIQDWYAPVAKANVSKGVLSVREMCEAAVEQSDNTCANALLARIGGPPAMTAFWRKIGDRETRLDAIEPYLNRTPLGGVENTTTPRAMANTLRALVLGHALSDGSRATLTQWLVGCRTGDDRLRAGLPTAWVTGDKTGNNGGDAAGDIAVTWPRENAPVIICAYTRGGSPDSAQFKEVFAGIGRYVGANLA